MCCSWAYRSRLKMSKSLSEASAEEILAELQRRIHCRSKKESRTIVIGPPGCVHATDQIPRSLGDH